MEVGAFGTIASIHFSRKLGANSSKNHDKGPMDQGTNFEEIIPTALVKQPSILSFFAVPACQAGQVSQGLGRAKRRPGGQPHEP